MLKSVDQIKEKLFDTNRSTGEITHIPLEDDPEGWTVEVVTLTQRNDGNDDVAYRRNGPWGTHDDLWECGKLDDACEEALKGLFQ